MYNSVFRRNLAVWTPNASTPSKNSCAISRNAPQRCGGIFDFDAKQKRLAEVAKLIEDPAIWEDNKRAQELGKERKSLEATVSTPSRLDNETRDALELFEMARTENDEHRVGFGR